MELEGCSPLLSITSALPEKPEWAGGVSGMRELGGLYRTKGRLIKGKRMFIVGLGD